MDGGDPETLAAYYCFVNMGWPPSKYESLPYRIYPKGNRLKKEGVIPWQPSGKP